MYKLISAVLLTASAALAFTPTHLVIMDSTPLYEKGHPFDEEHILTYLEYWTELAASTRHPVIWRTEPYWQAYYVVTVESGAEGLVTGPDAGGALVAFLDNAPVYPHGSSGEIIDTLDKGEVVAYTNIMEEPTVRKGCYIRTKEKLDGWVDSFALEPTYVFPTPTYKKYGRPQGGPPQHAGKE